MSDAAPALAALGSQEHPMGEPLRDAVAALDMDDPDSCPLPQLALNSSNVPGALGFDLDGPVEVGGLVWTPEDGAAFASPIGVALAAEVAPRVGDAP